MKRFLLFSLFTALVVIAACAKPWTHDKLTGDAADRQYKIDSVDCQAVAGKEFPLNKLAQDKRFVGCMSDKGWLYHPEGKGYRFQTKPR